jgi:hypothetical protein
VAAFLFLLTLGAPVVRSAATEDQLAAQGVVVADAERLLQLWVAYQFSSPVLSPPLWWLPGALSRPVGVGGLAAVNAVPGVGPVQVVGAGAAGALGMALSAAGPGPVTAPPPALGFAASVTTLDLLLPVLAFDTDQVSSALDAVGYGPGAQEVNPMTGLLTDVDLDLTPLPMPVLGARTSAANAGLTVKDVLDWTSDLAGGASYDLVQTAGQLGIDLLADQADELFWIVDAMLNFPGIAQIADPQVQSELTNLARDLDALARLSN